jgi:hypothetical protein
VQRRYTEFRADSLLSDMRNFYRYKIVSSQHRDAFEKDVNACLEQLYELYGSPFSCDDEYVQALVRSEEVPATDVPSTLGGSDEAQT